VNRAGLATVVLAAGAGTRFGGAKQLALVEGRPVLSRVLEALPRAGERRLVVLGAAAERVRPLVQPPWEAVLAADWEDGPGASLRAGLEAAADAEAVLIVLGDLAWLQPEAVERVLAAADANPDAEALRATEAGRPGHPLLIRGALLTAARAAPDAGLRPLLAAVPVQQVDCSGLGACRDVDRPGDVG
jgi:CTP:molybdopterin cytidylyltransferase MocA